MMSPLDNPLLWLGLLAALSLTLLPAQRERRRRLHALAALLRAADPRVRVETLEKAHALAPRDRSRLARLLRRELAISPRTGASVPQGRALTIWLIRQILALLGDPRTPVRMDAARLLRAVMGTSSPRALAEEDGAPPLSPAVSALVELVGGRVLSAGLLARQDTRVLAFAELLEAGIRPLLLGPQMLEGLGEEALQPLSSALRDRSPRVRRSLCEVLAAMGGDRAIELLIPMLEDPSPELRARAAEALGALKATAASRQLTALLRDPSPQVRAAAASALAQAGLEAACRDLVPALLEESRRDDASEAARAAMIDAIARLSDGGRPELAHALGALPRPLASRLAASLEDSGAVERWLSEERPTDELMPALLASAVSLGVTRPFLEALDSAEDRLRSRAAAALGHSQEPAALPALAALLADPEAGVRAQAVGSLAQLARPLVLAPLARAAADPDQAVRLAAVTGLKQVLSRRAAWNEEVLPADFDLEADLAECQRALLQGAADPQETVRAQAAPALGLLGLPQAAEALVQMATEDPNKTVRDAAGAALAQAGFPHSRRLLAAALDSPQEELRARAMSLLGALGGPEAARHLVEALSDPAPQVRQTALDSLSRLELSPARDRLLAELRNPDPAVRAGVAALIARLRAPQAASALVEALADPEDEVRANALAALAALGRPARKHRAALSDRLNDPSPRVREAAAAALAALRAAFEQAGEATELLRQGPLSNAGAAALIELAAGGDLEPLLRALETPQSAQSLASFLAGPGRQRLQPLLAALRQAEQRDQVRAVAALSQALRLEGAADSYLAELRAIDPGVRLMAVEIAGLLATPQAVHALVQVLEHDPVAEVRSRAASVLADAPGEPVQAALLRAHNEDADERVRHIAGHALRTGRRPEAGPALFPGAAPPGETAPAAAEPSS